MQRDKDEEKESGCCVQNDNSGCVQTLRSGCSVGTRALKLCRLKHVITFLCTSAEWLDGHCYFAVSISPVVDFQYRRKLLYVLS